MKKEKLWIIIGVVIVLMISMQGEKEGKKEAGGIQQIAYMDVTQTTTSANILQGIMRGQTFTPTSDFELTSVKVKIWAVGTTGTLTVSIMGTSGGIPPGPVLSSTTKLHSELPPTCFINCGPVAVYKFDMPAYTFTAGTMYALVFESDGNFNNRVHVKYHWSDATYPGGEFVQDTTGTGSGWIVLPGSDLYFEIWGTGPQSCPTLESNAFNSITSWVTEPVAANKAAKRATAVTTITEWITSC